MVSEYTEKNKKYIKQLTKLNAGDLAALRRNVDNPQKNTAILPILARVGAINSFEKSLIACLYAIYHREGDTPYENEKFNFGESFQNAVKGNNSNFKPDEHDNRFKILIASDKDELPFKLRQAVKLIKSKEQQIDFSILLRDIYNWEHENRWIQREWVRGFYNINKKNNNEGE